MELCERPFGTGGSSDEGLHGYCRLVWLAVALVLVIPLLIGAFR